MVNAKHARPLAAFWLLALAAALITALGLLGDRPGTQARHGSPIRVPSSAAPDLVLGGVLQAQPNRTVTSLLTPDLWVPEAAPATAHGTVRISTSSTPSATHKARTKSGDGQHTTTVRARPSGSATVPTTTTTTRGHGKGRKKSGEAARTTTTATVTATAKAPAKQPKHGHGAGRPDNPGKGHKGR